MAAVVDWERRAELLRATRERKLEAIFAGRTFEIVEEVHLPVGKVFKNALGLTGRHGWIIRDTATGQEHVVGGTLLRQIHDRFQGVELPYRTRRRRKPGAE